MEYRLSASGAAAAAAAPEEVTEFPVSLVEYAHGVGLDPLIERALSVWVEPRERLRAEWAELERQYRLLPIP